MPHTYIHTHSFTTVYIYVYDACHLLTSLLKRCTSTLVLFCRALYIIEVRPLAYTVRYIITQSSTRKVYSFLICNGDGNFVNIRTIVKNICRSVACLCCSSVHLWASNRTFYCSKCHLVTSQIRTPH